MATRGDRHPWLIVIAGGAAALLAVAAGFAMGDGAVEQWRLAARWTARVGFPIFLTAYLASSLYRLWPSDRTRALLRQRRWWGLGFAASHTVHLVALVTYLQISGDSRPASVLIGGGLGYVLLYAMAATSNQASMRTLGRNWKRLHTLGIHYLWFIYAFSYAGRLFDPERQIIGQVFAPIAFAALAVRVWARLRREPLAATT
jgi:DMSO/TMAO reductase YedYZ heme-binding membrane subunit